MDPAMNYCSVCAAPVTLKVPAGDSLARHVCDACGAIHYRNPRLVVGALPEWEDRILLCRRAPSSINSIARPISFASMITDLLRMVSLLGVTLD